MTFSLNPTKFVDLDLLFTLLTWSNARKSCDFRYGHNACTADRHDLTSHVTAFQARAYRVSNRFCLACFSSRRASDRTRASARLGVPFVDGIHVAYSLFPATDLFTARKMSEFESELSGKR